MRTFPIYDITDQLPWLIPVILLAFFGAIVLAVIMSNATPTSSRTTKSPNPKPKWPKKSSIASSSPSKMSKSPKA